MKVYIKMKCHSVNLRITSCIHIHSDTMAEHSPTEFPCPTQDDPKTLLTKPFSEKIAVVKMLCVLLCLLNGTYQEGYQYRPGC